MERGIDLPEVTLLVSSQAESHSGPLGSRCLTPTSSSAVDICPGLALQAKSCKPFPSLFLNFLGMTREAFPTPKFSSSLRPSHLLQDGNICVALLITHGQGRLRWAGGPRRMLGSPALLYLLGGW